jgi:hypothetical protein
MAAKHPKVAGGESHSKALGFQKGYNFPLCVVEPPLTEKTQSISKALFSQVQCSKSPLLEIRTLILVATHQLL